MRKTRTAWIVESDYGKGWEETVEGEDRADALRLLLEYRQNQPEYPHVVRKVRFPVEQSA